MASTVAAALFHQPDCPDRKQGVPNGYTSEHDHCISDNQCSSDSTFEQANEDQPTSLSAVSSLPSDCCQGNTPRYVT
jgi:protein CLEC16A